MPDASVPPVPVSLPAFATADGVVRGSVAGLLVDPRGPVPAADAVVFTTPERLIPVPEGAGTVFSPVNVTAQVGAGRRHRPVASVAVADLGGVVAEVVRLSPQSPGLVVVTRAVDERGRPVRSSPAVVFVGALVTGGPPERPGDTEIANTLDLLLGMLAPTMSSSVATACCSAGRTSRRTGPCGNRPSTRPRRSPNRPSGPCRCSDPRAPIPQGPQTCSPTGHSGTGRLFSDACAAVLHVCGDRRVRPSVPPSPGQRAGDPSG